MHKELKHAVRWFSRKRVILFVLFFSVSLLGGAVYMITEKNKRLKDEYEKQEVYLRQKEALERLGLHIKAAESASRGYTLTDNKAFLKDFDADTRSIYEAGQEIQYIDDSDAKQTSTSLFLQLDTFVRQKVTFMQQVNALCAANRDSAKILIASGDGVRLSDSITAASRHIITNYKQSIALLKTSFWRVKELNNNIVYYSIIISILLIILLFYFLTKEIAATRNLGELIELQKEQYRTTLGSMAEGVITTDKNGRIKYMNPSAEQITGWKKQEAKNMPLHLVYDVSSESIDEPFDNIVNRILKSGVAITLENSTLLKTRYNEELIINNSGTPLINQKKEIAGVVLVFNDITEKKKAEHALKISEQKYRNLIEQASDGIVIYSYDGIIHEFNRVAYELCGYTRHEFEKLNINEILFENKIGSDPAITEKLSKGEKILFERTIKRKDGTTFVVEINAGKFDADRLVAFVRDISERKAAEKELAESEYNLRTIFETEPECIKLLNEKGELLNMNPAGLAMIEADNLDMVKGNSVLGVVLPQYRVAFANLVKMVFEGRTEKLEFEIEGFKGTRRWMETHAVPLKDAAGKVISLLSVTRETTERKNAEEAMQKALKRYDILSKATSDTIWDWDIENNTMLYNDGITTMFGYKKSTVHNIVEWWQDNIHPDDLGMVTISLDEIFSTAKQTMQLEYRFRCEDGNYKYIYDRAFVKYNTEGKPTRMIGAMQDITHKKEEELRISKTILETQEAEREQLGMELHDNVNQLLTASLLYLGIAKKKEDEKKNQIDAIETCKTYITDALNEIRKLSHQLAPASFDELSLKDIFEQLIISMTADKSLTVNLHFDKFEKNYLSSEIQVSLYRIMQEQMNNIIKHAEATVIDISVTVSQTTIILSITDNGIGFDPKSVKNGIGLENIKRRAKAFSGKFISNSSQGCGCQIIISIPLYNKQ